MLNKKYLSANIGEKNFMDNKIEFIINVTIHMFRKQSKCNILLNII